ncbi:uncharacterized protein LOC110699496 [Chenopodium quinoa]|uniref:uncharacterized protein LOC110699496 n=1 Tax=Chenopodium quinoa TaxID=63459 RepID=UPI000B797781|nr:uncharacterized protein LOC110699496 [Chenopodium quinoa]
MPVSVYYGQLHSLWQELDHHEPLISCSVSGCLCGRLHEERRAQAKLHDFLMGLYLDFYSSLHTQILSQDPLPSLDRAYQLVTQEECVRLSRKEAATHPTEAVGFAVRTGADAAGVSRGRGRGYDKPLCTKCHKTGHEASTCWADKVCAHCKKKGHPKTHCFEIVGRPGSRRQDQGRGQPRANAAACDSQSSASNSSTVSALGQLFTPEQWKAIAGVVGNAQIPENILTGPSEGADWNGN